MRPGSDGNRMLETLGDRLTGVFDRLTGRGVLTERDVDEALREEASGQVVIEARSGPYRAACKAPWARVWELRVVREADGEARRRAGRAGAGAGAGREASGAGLGVRVEQAASSDRHRPAASGDAIFISRPVSPKARVHR